jgi:nucleotide-binding universal stress UspA family protein
MFQRALLTLDRSPFSEEAIPRVTDATTNEVVVLGVLDSVAEIMGRAGPVYDVPREVAEEIRRAEEQAVQAQLDAAAARLEEAGVAQVSTLVRDGKPGPEIVRAAKEAGCDVIVMSTHGRSGVKRAMLGSVANYVVHNIEGAAVLLVRPAAEGMASWA